MPSDAVGRSLAGFRTRRLSGHPRHTNAPNGFFGAGQRLLLSAEQLATHEVNGLGRELAHQPLDLLLRRGRGLLL